MFKSTRLALFVSLLSGLILLSPRAPGAAIHTNGSNQLYLPTVLGPHTELWINVFGSVDSEVGKAAFATPDGGSLLLIETGFNNHVVKLSVSGDVLWQKQLDVSGDDFNLNGAATNDGGFIISGLGTGDGDANAQVIKLNSNGTVAWAKRYGGLNLDFAESIQQTADNGYIFTGYTGSYGVGFSDLWLVKLDQTGSVEWQKAYAANVFHYGTAVRQTSDGGYILTGHVGSGSYVYDIWLLKIDSSGTIVWQKNFGGAANEYGRDVIQTSDGGYILAGSTESTGAGGFDAWLLKLNSSGSVIWQKSYGGPGDDEAHAIVQTSDGRYAVAGITYSFGAGGGDAWLMLLDAGGSILWQKTYGGLDEDSAASIQQLSDGKFLLAGYTYSFGQGQSDAWAMTLDAGGGVGSCSLIASSAAIITDTNFTGQSNPVTTTISSTIPSAITVSILNTPLKTVHVCGS